MKHPSKPLSASFVKHVKRPGRYGDGGRGSHGLYLRVWRRPNGRIGKAWAQRLRVGGKVTSLGLGPYPVVTLAEARGEALGNRRATHAGRDPRGGGVPTFEAAAKKVVELHSRTWKAGARLPREWEQTLADYAFPTLGRKSVAAVTTGDVLAVLTPIWHAKPATAKKVRQRIGAVMKWVVAQGHRTDNPAGEEIKAALPNGSGRTRHHRALPHDRVAEVLSKTRDNINGLALRFVALTACRVSEVARAKWSEIDGGVWTIPASRMKTKKEHRVPLSSAALRVLAEAKSDSPFVFPGRGGKPIARQSIGRALNGTKATPHGFRSSFRDWCSETGVPREVAERALAHVVGNRVEAAYNRTDLLERRREVMEAWGRYLS